MKSKHQRYSHINVHNDQSINNFKRGEAEGRGGGGEERKGGIKMKQRAPVHVLGKARLPAITESASDRITKTKCNSQIKATIKIKGTSVRVNTKVPHTLNIKSIRACIK